MAKGRSVAAALKPDSEARWRAESDLSTLMQAREIKKDKARLRNARAIAAEQQKALAALDD